MPAVDFVNRYFANYETLKQLAEMYATVQTEAEAGELYDRYKTLQGLNRVLADSLAGTWNYIFDNKNYRAIGEWFVSEYEGQIPDAVRDLVEAVVTSKAKIAELEAAKAANKAPEADVTVDASTEKTCPICGAKSDSKFCPQCGAPMGD